MNLTNEELILLAGILGAQTNMSVNKANDEFYGIYDLAENYVKPDKEEGFETPSDKLWLRLMEEAEKRNIIKVRNFMNWEDK